MKAIALLIGALLVALCVLVIWNDPAWVAQRQTDAAVHAARQADQLARERAAAPYEDASAAVVQITVTVVVVSLLIVIPALLGVGAVLFFRRRMALVYPDREGRLPVRLGDQDYQRIAAAALAAFHQAEITRADRSAAVPTSLTITTTYAPEIELPPTHRESSALDAPASHALPGEWPTFASLLSAGKIGRGNPLVMGIERDTGREMVGSWLDLYSTLLSGLPGTGKTTTQRFFAAQMALFGARMAIIDPHAGAGEESLAETLAPLSGCFLAAPASTDRAMLAVVKQIDAIGAARVQGRDRDQTPILLWVDETTKVLGRSSVAEELRTLLEQIAQEYRKKWVFAMCSGQIWTAERVPSELRDSFASVICHRMKRNQARLILPSDDAQQVERLEKGHAVFWNTSGESSLIVVPNTTAADLHQVAQLGGFGATAGFGSPPLNGVPPATPYHRAEARGGQRGRPGEAVSDAASPAAESGKTLSPEAAHILHLFRAGNDLAAIVRAVRGVTSSEGRRYQTALAEVTARLREAVVQREAHGSEE